MAAKAHGEKDARPGYLKNIAIGKFSLKKQDLTDVQGSVSAERSLRISEWLTDLVCASPHLK